MLKWLFSIAEIIDWICLNGSLTPLLRADLLLPVTSTDENTSFIRVSDSLSDQSGVRGRRDAIRAVLD